MSSESTHLKEVHSCTYRFVQCIAQSSNDTGDSTVLLNSSIIGRRVSSILMLRVARLTQGCQAYSRGPGLLKGARLIQGGQAHSSGARLTQGWQAYSTGARLTQVGPGLLKGVRLTQGARLTQVGQAYSPISLPCYHVVAQRVII